MTVRELKQRMLSDEVTDWAVADEVEAELTAQAELAAKAKAGLGEAARLARKV